MVIAHDLRFFRRQNLIIHGLRLGNILQINRIQGNALDGVQHILFSRQRHGLGVYGEAHLIPCRACRLPHDHLQRHLLGGLDGYTHLHQLHRGPNGGIVHLDVIIVIELKGQCILIGLIAAGDIYGDLGIADIYQVIPLTVEQDLIRIQNRILSVKILFRRAGDLAHQRHLRGVQLPYRHRHSVCAGPVYGDGVFRYPVGINHLIGQALGAHLRNGTGVHHDANVILVDLPELAAGTLESQVDGGVIARQQHQALVRQGGALPGEFHRDVLHLHRHAGLAHEVHIQPNGDGGQNGYSDAHHFAFLTHPRRLPSADGYAARTRADLFWLPSPAPGRALARFSAA